MKESKNKTKSLLVSLVLSQLLTPAYAKPFPFPIFSQPIQELQPLTINTPVEKELKGNQSNNFSISAKANDYLNLIVEQKGIDVVVRIFSLSGELLREIDSPNGDQGEEPLEIIFEKDGNYRLEIASLEKEAKPGKYEVTIKELRASTDKDSFLVKANSFVLDSKTLENSRKYDQAIPLLIQAIDIYKKVLGETHPTTVVSINDLAILYLNKDDYEKAEPLFIQALEIRRKKLGNAHGLTLISINNLARLYFNKSDYIKAEPLFIEALSISKNILEKDHPTIATFTSNLAKLYQDMGNYVKAEPLFIEALEIRRKKSGDASLATASSISNLAIFYEEKGDYTKAESFYTKALETYRNLLGTANPTTLQSINYLANLYQLTKNYAKAEPLFTEALEICKKNLGEKHPTTAVSMHDLAALYKENGDYDKAEPLFIQALEIRKKALGEDNRYTSNYINNLAVFYWEKGDYNKAESLFAKTLEIRKKALGNNHPDVFHCINNTARLYRDKGDYDKAESLFIEVIEACKNILKDNYRATTTVSNDLSRLYLLKGEYEKAVKYNSQANDSREKDLSRNLLIGSEKSKQKYLQKYEDETSLTLSLHLQNTFKNPTAAQSALIQILRRKGRALDVANQNVETLRKRSNPEDIALLDQLSEKNNLYSNLTLQGAGNLTPDEYKNKLNLLQEEIDSLQYKISQKSIEFSIQSQTINLENIQKAIPTNSTLVEFASYQLYDIKTNSYGTRHYAVYLLGKNGNLKWADLGESEAIDNLIDDLREKLRNKKTSVNKEIKPLARKLDKLVMQPVRNLIPKGNHLLIAPDGKLNLIPFETLVDQRGRFLVETCSLSYLTSGRDLLRLKTKIESTQSPVIIGNPDFGITELTTTPPNSTRTLFSDLYFSPLKATETEAKSIKKLLSNAQLFLEKDASEQTLVSLNAPAILHIATHGFFLKEENSLSREKEIQDTTRIARRKDSSIEEAPLTKIENPLLRSGIALAGANLHQAGENTGIFTALKATSLNLWGTKIVVLSACDTGVGEIKTGDGVYGLRRALVLAGSETQMMSLWPISDNGTKDLMISYYSKLKKGLGRGDALRQTQLELLKDPKYHHPFYWASFVQSGQWAKIDKLK